MTIAARSACVGVVAACLGVAGCGAAPAPRPVASVAAEPACPVALKPTADAPERVTAATRRELRDAFRGVSLEKASIRAVAGLDGATLLPQLDARGYLAAATRACGARVAKRSWIALVWLPSAPFARVAAGAVYTVRTRSGWRPWFVWFPFDHSGYRLPRPG